MTQEWLVSRVPNNFQFVFQQYSPYSKGVVHRCYNSLHSLPNVKYCKIKLPWLSFEGFVFPTLSRCQIHICSQNVLLRWWWHVIQCSVKFLRFYICITGAGNRARLAISGIYKTKDFSKSVRMERNTGFKLKRVTDMRDMTKDKTRKFREISLLSYWLSNHSSSFI